LKFTVEVKEIHIATVEVEADSIDEALEKAKELAPNAELEYHSTMDTSQWNVINEKGAIVF